MLPDGQEVEKKIAGQQVLRGAGTGEADRCPVQGARSGRLAGYRPDRTVAGRGVGAGRLARSGAAHSKTSSAADVGMTSVNYSFQQRRLRGRGLARQVFYSGPRGGQGLAGHAVMMAAH